MSKVDTHCTYLSTTLIDYTFKMGEKYYLQGVFR